MARGRVNVLIVRRERASHTLRAGPRAPRPFGKRQADAGRWTRASALALSILAAVAPPILLLPPRAGSGPAHAAGLLFLAAYASRLRVATALLGTSAAGACARGRDGSRIDRWAGPPGPVHRRRPDRDRPPLTRPSRRRADALPLARRARPDRRRRPGPAGAFVGCRARPLERRARRADPSCRVGFAAAAFVAVLPRMTTCGGSHALGSAAGSGRARPRCELLGRMGVSLCVLARPGSRALLLLGALGVGFSFALAVLYLSAGAAAGALPIGPAARPRPASAPRRSSPQVSGRRRRSTSPWPARR